MRRWFVGPSAVAWLAVVFVASRSRGTYVNGVTVNPLTAPSVRYANSVTDGDTVTLTFGCACGAEVVERCSSVQVLAAGGRVARYIPCPGCRRSYYVETTAQFIPPGDV